MSKIIADDAAFECALKDGAAILRLKKDAVRLISDAGSRDNYLNVLDRLEADSDVIGLIHINDETFPGEAELAKLLNRIIEDKTYEKVIGFRFRHWLSQIVHRRLQFQKPIVAGAAGPLTMEELGSYLMSDRLLVSDDFSIRNATLRMGMPPGPLLTYLLPRILGPRRALKLLTEDETITASDALDLGLVDKIVPAAQFEQECMAEMQKLVLLPNSLVSATRELVFSHSDKFEEHLDHSLRHRMHFIRAAKLAMP